MSSAVTDRIEAHVWRIAFVVIIGSIMSILDTTIVNVALETLGHDLHKPIADTQWVITGYMLSLAAVIPITGWAARRFGAKPVYLLSLVLFTAGSALCGIAQSLDQLIVFRVIQGIGGGMVLPLGQLMMATAAETVVAEVEEIVEAGQIDPDHIVTAGIFVNRIVPLASVNKRIEQRTVRKRF